MEFDAASLKHSGIPSLKASNDGHKINRSHNANLHRCGNFRFHVVNLYWEETVH
jgi:hypothetical protein